MKSAILVTGHYFNSKRRAGFHWLADALSHQGWEVVFFTAAISWLSFLRRDYRLEYPILQQANRLILLRPRIGSYIWFTPWHPANLRLSFLNYFSQSLFSHYGELSLGIVESMISDADLIIFESTPGILLFERFKQLNPNAKFIYRVSDNLRLLRNHPVVLETEQRVAPQFDLVSVPSQHIYRIFKGLPNLELHLHGIQKNLFQADYPNPYASFPSPNLVFVGNSYFDHDFIKYASQLFPDWNFHIIGPIPNLPHQKNIITYGELPFKKTIAYIKYADIGLQTLSSRDGVESLSDSLKMIQYTYCNLPIIAPAYLRSSRSHVFYYEPKNRNSIYSALIQAADYDRSQIQTHDIYSWDELVEKLLESADKNRLIKYL